MLGSSCGTGLQEGGAGYCPSLQLSAVTGGGRGAAGPKVHGVSLVDVSLASLRVWVGEQASTGVCADLSNHSSEYSGPVGFGCPAGSLQRSHDQ